MENCVQFVIVTLKTLKQNKSVHINLGGDNLHELQSSAIPETLTMFTLSAMQKERGKINLYCSH